MHNPVPLHVNQRAVTSPFGLVGVDENALTFALGYTFQQYPPLLQWFLSRIGIPGIRSSMLRRARINLQRHRSGESGITDIEIHLPGRFHVIVEAKIGLAVPSVRQCAKYVPFFENEPVKKLVALVQSADESLVTHYETYEPQLKGLLKPFNWSKLFPECIRIMMDNSLESEAKGWVRSFYRFLDQEYTMKSFTTEVWILAISTEPLWQRGNSHWDVHKKYRVWWDYREHAVRPLYLAFRVDGQLDSVGRVNRIEHGVPIIDLVPEMRNSKNKWHRQPCTIWHFDPLFSLPTPIRTGKGMYNRRVRCDFDLLLTCKTVQEIEESMKERRERTTSRMS